MGWNIELPCSEEVQEDCETIGVSIDEEFVGIKVLEVPLMIKHCAEEGISAGIG